MTRRREKTPEFGLAGVVIGLFAGLAVGLVAELITGRGMIVMQAGGAAGPLLGAAFEGVRYWWRNRR